MFGAFQYEKIKRGKLISIERETILRIIIEIHKIDHALRSLFGKDETSITRWINDPNKGDIFQEGKVIIVMCKSLKNLSLTRQYLERYACNNY